MLYLYGPREDRAPDRPAGRRRRMSLRLRPSGWPVAVRPRYRLRRDVLWLALLPAGPGRLHGPTWRSPAATRSMPFHAQDVWGRHFAGPYLGVWDGVKAAFEGARQLLSFQRHHLYFPTGGGSPFVSAGHNLMLLAFLIAAVPAIVGVLRRLPLAYGAYVLAALALPLSYPVQLAAADVAAALSRGAVPAEHLAGGVAGRTPARPHAGAGGLGRC